MLDLSRISELRAAPVAKGRLLIEGAWRDAADRGALDVHSPIDGSVLTTIADATQEDAEAAVASARAAFEDGRWSGLAPAARKAVMLKWADLIEAEALELAVLGVRDNGTEIGMALKAEPMSAAGTIRYYAEALDKLYGEIAPTAPGTLGLVHREPAGVVAAIVPWNFPLMIGAWKLGPALAAGCSVVLKPAETASLSLLRLAELAMEAGVAPGDAVAQREVFGPVLAVIPFDTEEEAVRIANGTEFGLAAAVWTGNLSRAHRMVKAVRAGVVHVNTYGGADGTAPLGGVKQSGNGHDKSLHAFDKHLDPKTAWIKL
ncbi:aldehyde dehydrogenase family protein [Rhodovulum sp. DZ06]|uniref:aldehyde dehydrogenase family protein n=1 Tax=Rhodovulum sp. DZ06 TaxID=3425126 RepID=UPI003D34A4F2